MTSHNSVNSDLADLMRGKTPKPLVSFLHAHLKGEWTLVDGSSGFLLARVFIDTMRSTGDAWSVGLCRDAVVAAISESAQLPEFALLPGIVDLLSIASTMADKTIALMLCDIIESFSPASVEILRRYGDIVFEAIAGPVREQEVYSRVVRLFMQDAFKEFRAMMFFRLAHVRGMTNELVAHKFSSDLDQMTTAERRFIQFGFSQQFDVSDIILAAESLSVDVAARLILHLMLSNRYCAVELAEEAAGLDQEYAGDSSGYSAEAPRTALVIRTKVSERSHISRDHSVSDRIRIQYPAPFFRAQMLQVRGQKRAGRSLANLLEDEFEAAA